MTAGFWPAYILRSFRRGGRRTVVAVICVALGVAAVVALQLASLTIRSALVSDVRASNGGDISLVMESAALSRPDLAVFRDLQRAGRISSWVAVASSHATAISASHLLVPFEVDVVSVPPYPLGGQPTFVNPKGGVVAALLARHGDALITSVLADELGVSRGARVQVSGIGAPGLTVSITGVLAESSFSHAAAMTVEQRDASLLLQGQPQYGAVYANAADPTAVVQTLRARFPTAIIQTVPEALMQDEQQVHDFTQFNLLIGLMALAIAGIGILNAMQSLLSWRRLEIAMLKALGFGQASLYLLFGGEAILMGLIGGLVGSAVGAGLGQILTTTLARVAAVQVTFRLDPGTLLSGVLLGVGSTLVFAILPVARAAGLRPIEILRQSGEASAASRLPQTLGLLMLVAVLFAALATAVVGDLVLALQFAVAGFLAAAVLTALFAALVAALSRLGPSSRQATGLGVLAALLGLTGLAVARFPAVVAVLALAALLWGAVVLVPTPRFFSLLIALRSLGRRRARTAVTLVAFLVGVLGMSLTLTVAFSLQRQIADALAAARAQNMVAIADENDRALVLRASQHLPGVRDRRAVTTATTLPLAVDGRPLSSLLGPAPSNGDVEDSPADFLRGVTGYNLGAGRLPQNLTLVAGRPLTTLDAGTGHVLLNVSLQRRPLALRLGDRVTLRGAGAGQTRAVTVVGFYRLRGIRRRGFASFFSPPILGDRSLALSLAGANAQTLVSFTVAPQDLAADATALQRTVPSALVLNINDLTAVLQQILNDLLSVLVVITALALGAGLAVIGNGVTLAMLERHHEIGVYKAVGFEPRHVLRFVLLENALIGLIAGAVSVLLVAVALAVLSHIALQTAIGFDPTLAVLVLLAAALLAVAVAYLSARTPVRIRPIEALRNE